MRRLVIDTNVYVEWLNGRRHEALVFQPDAVKYLSAVVLMELRAGAFSPGDRRALRRLEAAFARAGRLLAPPRAVFADAGDTLRRLQAEHGYDVTARHSIVNDVLIALSARLPISAEPGEVVPPATRRTIRRGSRTGSAAQPPSRRSRGRSG